MLIKLPFPDSRLNPNKKNGKHWGTTNAVKVEAFKYAYYSTLQAMAGENYKSIPLSLELTFVQPDRRKRDLDNLLSASKSQIDGVCKALGIDDYAFHEVRLKRDFAPKQGELLVRIVKLLRQGE